MKLGKRIVVLGSPGSGKSTFSGKLSAVSGLPLIHLDQFYWNPGWVVTPEQEWQEKHARLLAQECWIIDGCYKGTLEPRLKAADTAILIDRGRMACIWAVLKRWQKNRGRTRPDMPADCPEKVDLEFLRYIWEFQGEYRSILLDSLKRFPGAVYILHSFREMDDWIAAIQGGR